MINKRKLNGQYSQQHGKEKNPINLKTKTVPCEKISLDSKRFMIINNLSFIEHYNSYNAYKILSYL